jgi:uncharacterized protein YndB with AHSA1/START domain
MSGHGNYDKVDGRLALRYERHLLHPIQTVWEAVTQPAGLARWFPCRIEGELRAGGRLRFIFPADNTEVGAPSHGEVLDVDPPLRFWFTWEAEEIRIDLAPRPNGGCVLTFVDLMPDDYAPGAARTAAGWHVCLNVLEALLDGHPVSVPSHEPTERFRELYDSYIARGVPHGAPIPPVSSLE